MFVRPVLLLYIGFLSEKRGGKRVAAIFLLRSMRFRDIGAEIHMGRGLRLAITAKTLAGLRIADLPAL